MSCIASRLPPGVFNRMISRFRAVLLGDTEAAIDITSDPGVNLAIDREHVDVRAALRVRGERQAECKQDQDDCPGTPQLVHLTPQT